MANIELKFISWHTHFQLPLTRCSLSWSFTSGGKLKSAAGMTAAANLAPTNEAKPCALASATSRNAATNDLHVSPHRKPGLSRNAYIFSSMSSSWIISSVGVPALPVGLRRRRDSTREVGMLLQSAPHMQSTPALSIEWSFSGGADISAGQLVHCGIICPMLPACGKLSCAPPNALRYATWKARQLVEHSPRRLMSLIKVRRTRAASSGCSVAILAHTCMYSGSTSEKSELQMQLAALWASSPMAASDSRAVPLL
mmetsp:Transcript_17259/g.41257  ORF Transcript_17259/g.41257 Transcript_17259/m.41257 type:complete len:255 (-) Transcript_17259:263-1027(-)